MNILPFTEDMIPAAGRLLAARHAKNRQALPLLPERFEDSQTAARAVGALWGARLKSGYAAFRNGELAGYLLGELVVQPWGRVGYVYLAGYALAEGESPRLLQDLYARLGDEWVRKGILIHDIYVPSVENETLRAFFDIGFGKERVDALLDLGKLDIPRFEAPAGVEIRRAGRGDNALLGDLSGIISRALAGAPYWHVRAPEEYEELREGWAELADDPDWLIWLALENGKALGMVGLLAEPEADTKLLAAPGTVYLSLGVTDPAARGRGIGTALTWRSLEQVRALGFQQCYSNWISPNLLASRFWPRFGFTDSAYRLAKRVDAMAAWSRE